MKPYCILIASSKYSGFFPSSKSSYNQKYDQGIYLTNCGIKTKTAFLEPFKQTSITVTGV